MAAAVRTSVAGGSSSGTGNRTATITPAVNDLFVVYCCVAANTNDTPTCSDDNGGSYDLIDVMNFAIATVNYRMSVFVRTSLLANTTSTVVTVATGSNTSGAVHVLAITGVTRVGADAVRSKGSQNNQAAGTGAPTLNQSALTNNPTLAAIGSADTTTTAPTNWTEIQDTNFSNDTVALEEAFRASGFTGTTITFGAAQSTQFCAHAMELDTTVLLTQSPTDSVNNLADASGLGYGNLHADSVNVLADTATIVMGHVFSFSDSVNNLADGSVRVIGILNPTQDSLQALTDALAQLLSYQLLFADSEAANWADSHNLLLSQFLALTDTNTIADAALVNLEHRESLADSYTLSDSLEQHIGTTLQLADDANNLTDSYSQTESYRKSFSETLSPTPVAPHGLNFRSTLGFVTDGTDQTFVGAGDTYPTTSDGVTFGYASPGTAIDNDNGIDVRLAGEHIRDNDSGTATFRIDLEPGDYNITLALGSASLTRLTYFELLDNNSSLFSLGLITTLAGEFADAEGTIFSAADWPANNVSVPVTVSSGILRFVLGTNVEDVGASAIAHLAFAPLGAGATGLADDFALGYGLRFDDAVDLSDSCDQELLTNERKLILNDTFALSDLLALGHGQLHADSLNPLTDAVVMRSDGGLLAADVLTLTDSETHTLDPQLAFTETISLTDSLTLGHGLTHADALSFTDAYADELIVTILSLTEELADDLNLLSDSFSLSLGLTFTDTLANLADVETHTLGHSLTLAESIANLSDSVSLQLQYLTDFNDSLTLTDSESAILGQRLSFADSIDNLTDAATLLMGQRVAFADSLATFADAYVQQLGELLAFNDSLTLTDSIQLGYGLVLNDNIDLLIDSITTSAPQGPLRQVGVTDSVDILADLVALRLDYLLVATDATSLDDSLALNEGLFVAFTDVLSLTDTTTSALGHLVPLADALALSDSIQLRLGYELSLTDVITLTDRATLNLNYFLTLADNAALLADSTLKSLGLTLIITDNASTPTDAISLFSAWLLQLSDALTLTDSITRSGAGFLPLTDSLALADSVAIELRGPDLDESLADALTLADAISLALGNELQLQVVISDLLTLADHYFDLRHPYTPSTKRHIVVPSRARMTTPTRRREVIVPASNRTTRVE